MLCCRDFQNRASQVRILPGPPWKVVTAQRLGVAGWSCLRQPRPLRIPKGKASPQFLAPVKFAPVKLAARQAVYASTASSFEMPESQRSVIAGTQQTVTVDDDQASSSWRAPSSLASG